MFAHTTRIYAGKVDYALRNNTDRSFDPKTGTPILTSLSERNLAQKCTYIFADYRENSSSVWPASLIRNLEKDFIQYRVGDRNTHYYVSHKCQVAQLLDQETK